MKWMRSRYAFAWATSSIIDHFDSSRYLYPGRERRFRGHRFRPETRRGAARGNSIELFGVNRALDGSSTTQVTAAPALADPLTLVKLADGLLAKVITASAAPNVDMIALWPDDVNPTHLLLCNEEGTTAPGFQRAVMATGAVETIVTGTAACDGVRRTPWGTILLSEEAGGGPNGGRVYELVDPLNTTGVTLNRATGVFSGGTGAGNLTARPALGRLSFEGFAVYSNGVVYYGDENRPATGTAGGAFFKYIPTTLRNPTAGPITSLSQSPLGSGSLFGLRVGRRSGFTDFGQGTELGFGQWVPIPPGPDVDLRAQAATLRLTGYYRPEDIDIDLAAQSAGRVRFCSPITGNGGDDQYYGEVICITDGTIAQAAANTAIPEVQLFVAGNPGLAMPDNIAYQPGKGNWIIQEDADTTYLTPHNNDLWSCLPDGADENLLTDGCIRVATLNDLTAEWTGGIFDASGKKFFVSIQHNVSGKGVILQIYGWK